MTLLHYHRPDLPADEVDLEATLNSSASSDSSASNEGWFSAAPDATRVLHPPTDYTPY